MSADCINKIFSREYDLPKTFSLTENQFSGKTYFIQLPPGGAGDARGAPEGHHGIHDGGGEWSERNSNIGGLIQNPKCPANRVSRNRKSVETERRKPTPLYSPDALGGYQGHSSAR